MSTQKKTKLYEMRMRKKLTKTELSAETGVSVKVISELERGLKRADIGSVQSLAEYFGVSVETLMEAAGEGGTGR